MLLNINKYIYLLLFVVITVLSFLFIRSIKRNNLLHTPRGDITISIAKSQELRTTGLSNTEQLSSNQGMLFVFDTASRDNCFWMKDMNFSIDMVWLDSEKKVVTVKTDVRPETYPESFCPVNPALYGLEINANSAQSLGIIIGEELVFTP